MAIFNSFLYVITRGYFVGQARNPKVSLPVGLATSGYHCRSQGLSRSENKEMLNICTVLEQVSFIHRSWSVFY